MTKRTFKIYRYDPDQDAKPYMQTISIELDGTERMLLERVEEALGDVWSTIKGGAGSVLDFFGSGLKAQGAQEALAAARIDGVATAEQAMDWAFSGPMLRASGVPWDLRKVDHYECYDDFDWNVAWEKEGDCYARYLVRMAELRAKQAAQAVLPNIPMRPGEVA